MNYRLKKHEISYSIRMAVPADAPRIAALGAHVWLHTYAEAGVSDSVAQYVLATFTSDRIRDLIKNADIILLISETETSINGYIVMHFGSHHLDISTEIETLYVHPAFLRLGIGSSLLAHARNRVMKKVGSSSIWLTVNAQNKRAMSFYYSHGFVEDGKTYFELDGKKHENIFMLLIE